MTNSNAIPIRNLDKTIYEKFKKHVKFENKNIGNAMNDAMNMYLSNKNLKKGDKNIYKAKFKQAKTLRKKALVILKFINKKEFDYLVERPDFSELFDNTWKYLATKSQIDAYTQFKKSLIENRDLPKNEESDMILVDNDFQKDFKNRFERNPEIIVWFLERDKDKQIVVGKPSDFSALSIEDVIKQYHSFCNFQADSPKISNDLIIVFENRLKKLEERKLYLFELCNEIANEFFKN